MSALTNTFTAIANKIRTLLGTETTYTPSEMPGGIEDVYTAGAASSMIGTAESGDVLTGKSFTNSEGLGVGRMPDKRNLSFLVNSTNEITIPEGYYNGNGKITVSNLMPIPSDTKFIYSNGIHNVTNYANANVSLHPILSANGEMISNNGNQTVSVDCQGCEKVILIYICSYNTYTIGSGGTLMAERGILTPLYNSYGLLNGDKCQYGVRVYELTDLDNYIAITVNISQRTPSYTGDCGNLIAIKVYYD